jgi:hypothetical protein
MARLTRIQGHGRLESGFTAVTRDPFKSWIWVLNLRGNQTVQNAKFKLGLAAFASVHFAVLRVWKRLLNH